MTDWDDINNFLHGRPRYGGCAVCRMKQPRYLTVDEAVDYWRNGGEVVWRTVIAANGIPLVKLYCAAHGTLISNELPKRHPLYARLVKVEPDDDRRVESCRRCGGLGAELHHWAPKHLFDDADWWPTDYLCRECHTLWHRVTKTGAFRRAVS